MVSKFISSLQTEVPFFTKHFRYQKWRYSPIPVVPGQAGGGSFQKEKNYIAQKEFAYRMCARRPTSAMPKSFLCCERAFCRSMVVMFCALKWSVLMSWCLLRGQVMWWSRHLMRCNGLSCVVSRDAMRCHGDVLQSTTPILLRTTNTTLYYSSTTLYYKVPLKYYSVLLQYYLVLQSTTPVLPRTTKYFVIDPHHIWNVIYNAQSNRHHPPTSPNTAPATPNGVSWLIRITDATSFTMRGASRSNRHCPPTSANTAPASQNESHDWSASQMQRHLQCA